MVHCGACIHCFSMFPLFPSSLHTQFIQKLVQYQTDSHASVPFWFLSILSSFGETKMLISDLKKPWRSNEIQHFDNETSGEEEDDIHVRRDDSRYFLLFETAFESAPQFIIQLYVMAVQQESVMIVQIISLPVSFLSLARASVVADEVFHYDDRTNDGLNIKNRLLHFATHLLLLSSRLFAAALVTASYNTGLWVFFIFAFSL